MSNTPSWIKKSNGGPNTPAGKEISSHNATKHGCCSSALILPTEDIQDFKALEHTWCRTYEPQDTIETHLLHQLVEADWFHQRSIRHYAQVEARILSEAPDPFDWTEDHHRSLARFLRYRTTHANNVAKLRKAVEDHRKNRFADKLNIEKLALAFIRRNAQDEKSFPAPEPMPDVEKMLADMRQKAIRLGVLQT